MYIDCENDRKSNFEFGDGESWTRCAVKSGPLAIEGSVYFIMDANGIGHLEWCKGSTALGYGERISVKELFEFLENRNK